MAEASVAPRFDVKSNDKVDGFVTMSELMVKDVKMRPHHLMNIIEDVSGLPAFDIDSHGNIIGQATPVASVPMNESTPPQSFKEDCTAGCGQRGTVIPLNSSLKDWQCKSCGKQYKQN